MPRQKDSALRQRLLEAATTQFADRGYAGASIEAIGQAAGVTKGGVYFHFRSKEQLFFAALDYWNGELRRTLASGAASGLRGFLLAYLQFHFRHPEAGALLRVLATELQGRFTAQVRDDLRDVQRTLRSRIRELLIAGAREGLLFATDPAFAAFMLACSVEGVLQSWNRTPRDQAFFDPIAVTEHLMAPYETGQEPGTARSLEKEVGEDFLPPF